MLSKKESEKYFTLSKFIAMKLPDGIFTTPAPIAAGGTAFVFSESDDDCSVSCDWVLSAAGSVVCADGLLGRGSVEKKLSMSDILIEGNCHLLVVSSCVVSEGSSDVDSSPAGSLSEDDDSVVDLDSVVLEFSVVDFEDVVSSSSLSSLGSYPELRIGT